MKESSVIVKEVKEFTFGGNCHYKFKKPLVLNALSLRDQPGFVIVNRYLDLFFIGVGKSVESAIYDWESKFHGYFQRFEEYGFLTDKEEELYNILLNLMDMEAYKADKLYTKAVEGKICSCREDNYFPCSYSLKNSEEVRQFPEYTQTDPKLLVLEKGDSFYGIFEYKLTDNSLQRVLYIERLSNETDNT